MWLWLGLAMAGECVEVGLEEVTDVPAPAVIVLGERFGHQPDLKRADRVIATLARRGPVTVAVEAVSAEYQPVLDRFGAGELDAPDLPGLMGWDRSWRFSWKRYEPVVTSALIGARVRAIGVPAEPVPDGAALRLPPRYADVLESSMGPEPVPRGMEARFVQSVAWRDQRMAELAVRDWDGEGYVVVLVGRASVEGGLGIGWQIGGMVDAPVHHVSLVHGGNPLCLDGDRVWR